MHDTRHPTTEESTTDCDRCGRDRPGDPRRLTVAFADQTDATRQDERHLVCGACWHRVRDEARRPVA